MITRRTRGEILNVRPSHSTSAFPLRSFFFTSTHYPMTARLSIFPPFESVHALAGLQILDPIRFATSNPEQVSSSPGIRQFASCVCSSTPYAQRTSAPDHLSKLYNNQLTLTLQLTSSIIHRKKTIYLPLSSLTTDFHDPTAMFLMRILMDYSAAQEL